MALPHPHPVEELPKEREDVRVEERVSRGGPDEAGARPPLAVVEGADDLPGSLAGPAAAVGEEEELARRGDVGGAVRVIRAKPLPLASRSVRRPGEEVRGLKPEEDDLPAESHLPALAIGVLGQPVECVLDLAA